MSELKFDYYSDVIDGKINLKVSQRIARELRYFEGCRIHFTLEKQKIKRSNSQLRLWWVYMNILSKSLGYTKEEMHQICKMRLMKREKIDEHTGEIFEYLEETSNLTMSEFHDIISLLVVWSAETLGVVLPLPDEQTKLL